VVHRDLKPQNILITEEDRPKVTDFGLARIVDEQALSHTGDFAGTYFYMSPEQVAAKRAGLDHRTDVFSLGVVLYEMLCLQRPFQGDTEHQIAEQILIKEPPPLRAIRSKVPRDLAVICGKAMEKDRDKRYQSMGDLAADLRRWLSSQPIQATPPTAIDRVVKWARRNPTKSATGALSFVAVFALSWLGFDLAESNEALKTSNSALIETTTESELQSDRARAAEKLANERSYSASLYACQSALDTGNLREARRLLELSPEDNRDWEWDHLKLSVDSSLLTLEGHTDDVMATSWSPDGSRIVTSSKDKTIRIWEAKSGECLQILTGHLEAVYDVCWSPDGTKILSGSGDNTLRIWNASNGETLSVLEGHSEAVVEVSWGGVDGLQIASADRSEETPLIRIWDSVTGECTAILEGQEGRVNSVEWSPDGRKIASCSKSTKILYYEGSDPRGVTVNENVLLVWDLEKGTYENLSPEPDPEEEQLCIAWSPDSMLLVTGSSHGVLNIHDVSAGSRKPPLVLVRVKKANGQFTPLVSVHWSDDGTQILTTSADRILMTWRVADGLYRTISEGEDFIRCADWSPDGINIVADFGDGTAKVWASDTGTNSQVLEIARDVFNVSSLAASSDGTRLVSNSSGSVHRLWDLTNGVCIRQVEDWSQPSFAWNPNNLTYLTSSEYARFGPPPVRLWDSVTGKVLKAISASGESWSLVTWSPDESKVAAVSHIDPPNEGKGTEAMVDDSVSEIRIWNLTNGESRVDFKVNGSVSGLAWNPESTQLATSSLFGNVRLWDAQSGTTVKNLKTGREGSRCVAWSPDGSMIVAGSMDSTIRVWDVSTGNVLHKLLGHNDAVLSVCWNPSSTRIASGSIDQTIRIWSGAGGENLVVLKGHKRTIGDVEWSADGARIFSASNDSTVRIWESQLEDALPMWQHENLKRRLSLIVDDLLSKHTSLVLVQSLILEGSFVPSEQKAMALEIARLTGKQLSSGRNEKAWLVVDPDRTDFEGNLEAALHLAREGCLLDPDGPEVSDTLAWALFANELFDEAIEESKRALGLASENQKASYEANLLRIRQLIDAKGENDAPVK
jgi:WD40 repeat protein